MQRAIVIGASSGIGRELATILSNKGYTIGITARRLELLQELKASLPNPAYIKRMDLADHAGAMNLFEDLVREMGGVDLVVIAAGIGFINPDLNWTEEKKTIDVNVSGFAAVANAAYRYFARSGGGHLVGISSIAAIRGGHDAPAYSASKAFISNYLEGLRTKASKARLPIAVTDILPGFVDTAMAKGEGLFWVAPPAKAAKQIYNAIERKTRRAYITKRWRLIALLLKVMPDSLYSKL